MNAREPVRLQRSETFLAAGLLAVAGGFLDAYTYLCRGGVFANAQTGNMVLLAVRAAEGNWRTAASYLIPITAFFLGVLAAEAVKKTHRTAGRIHWRHTVLLAEIAVLAAAARIPLGEWNSVVNVLVSFVCALQAETFRKVRGNPFASTMCTGNLRSGTEALFHGLDRGDRVLLGKSGCYFGVIACFLAGGGPGRGHGASGAPVGAPGGGGVFAGGLRLDVPPGVTGLYADRPSWYHGDNKTGRRPRHGDASRPGL